LQIAARQILARPATPPQNGEVKGEDGWSTTKSLQSNHWLPALATPVAARKCYRSSWSRFRHHL